MNLRNEVLISFIIGLSVLPCQATEPRTDWQAEWERTVQAAKKEGVLSLYHLEGDGELGAIAKIFQKQFPEIRVVMTPGRGNTLGPRIMAERRAGKYLVDVYIAGATTAYEVFYRAKALNSVRAALILPEVTDESKWWLGQHHYIDPEGQYIFVYVGNVSQYGDLVRGSGGLYRAGFGRPSNKFEPSGEESRAKLALLNAPPEVLASMPDRPGSVFFTAQTRGDQFVGISAVFSRQEPVRRFVAKVHGVGDLDTILLKSLQKVPARRYLTVDDFASDIRRHLEGLPVRARPDTAAYRVSKFVARHKALVGGTAAALVVIIVALVVTLAAYRQATMATREAEWQAYVASLAAAEASVRADQVEEAASHLEAAPAHLRAWEWWHLRSRVDRSLESFRAHEKGITRIAFLPGGERLVTASIDSTIKIWKGTSGQLVRSYGPFSSEVESVSPVRGTHLIAAGLNDGRVLLMDEAGGASREIKASGPGWAFVSVSPDGSRLACGFFDGTVRVWSLPDGAALADWKAHDGLALPVYSPDGRFLATGGGDGTVTLHDARSLARLHAFRPHESRVYCMAFGLNDSLLVTGSMDRTVCVWSTRRREVIQRFREHRATINAIAFDPDGESVLTGASDSRLVRWNLTTGKVLGEFHGHFNDVSTLAGHPDGARVLSTDWNGFVKSWDWKTEDVRTLRIASSWIVPAIYDVAWSPEEDRLVAATNSGAFPVWGLSGGIQRSFLSSTARCVAFWPDSDLVVAANDEGQILFFRESDSSPVRAVTAHRRRILEMALDRDGGMLATVSADSSVKLWRLPDLEPIRSLVGHRGAVEDVEFAPGGARLASCGADSTIRLWDPASGRQASVLAGGGPVQDVAFDPSGTRLASASRGGGLRIWDLRDTRQVDSLGNRARVLSVAWSRDGARIAAGGFDGTVRLYDAGSGHEVMSLHGHVAGVTSLQFCRGDSLLTSSSLDGTVRIWDSKSSGVLMAALRR